MNCDMKGSGLDGIGQVRQYATFTETVGAWFFNANQTREVLQCMDFVGG